MSDFVDFVLSLSDNAWTISHTLHFCDIACCLCFLGISELLMDIFRRHQSRLGFGIGFGTAKTVSGLWRGR
jgi:hypothetical protein